MEVNVIALPYSPYVHENLARVRPGKPFANLQSVFVCVVFFVCVCAHFLPVVTFVTLVSIRFPFLSRIVCVFFVFLFLLCFAL